MDAAIIAGVMLLALAVITAYLATEFCEPIRGRLYPEIPPEHLFAIMSTSGCCPNIVMVWILAIALFVIAAWIIWSGFMFEGLAIFFVAIISVCAVYTAYCADTDDAYVRGTHLFAHALILYVLAFLLVFSGITLIWYGGSKRQAKNKATV